MMSRFLIYSLTLLTLLAGLFVMSACQKDLPETTEVMVTFTTRAFVKQEGGTTDAIAPEKMKDLRVIVFDGDNVVVGNDVREDINEKSVVFSYATLVSDGETFKFLAIANEKSAGLAEVLADIGVGSKITNAQIDTWKTLTISNNLNPTADAPLLQSKFWTWTSQKDAPDPNATLDYAASKISVQFKNETNAVQSLTDIKIAGIGSATKAYLFAQADNDFANMQNPPSDIAFEDVENLLPGTFSTIQNYYSNPLKNISSPKLTAKWNGEVRELSLSKDQNGNEIDLTSLGRNEYLQILVTLTGEGPKVTYTIHSWEDNNTNIGDTAPTTPGNDYYVDAWGENSNIEIGGENKNDWTLSDGTIIKGEQIEEDWTGFASDQNDQLRVYIPNDKLIVGNRVVLDFQCAYNNCNQGQNFKIRFSTDQYNEQSIEPENSAEDKTYVYEKDETHIRYLTLTESVIGKLHKPDYGAPNGQNDNYKVLILLTYDANCNGTHKFGVKITKFGLITPSSATQ